MRLGTENQRFVAMLAEVASDEDLPETFKEHSRRLIAEMKRLVADDEIISTKLLDHIEYGLAEHEFPRSKELAYGLKVKGTNVLLSDAMHAFENMISSDLPASLKDYYPELSHEQWQAIIRMAIDVISALDRRLLDAAQSNNAMQPTRDTTALKFQQ